MGVLLCVCVWRGGEREGPGIAFRGSRSRSRSRKADAVNGEGEFLTLQSLVDRYILKHTAGLGWTLSAIARGEVELYTHTHTQTRAHTHTSKSEVFIVCPVQRARGAGKAL